MKKALLTVFGIFQIIFCAAGDIIVTKDKQKIDAIIQEVAPKEIRYKKASNPNGPTFVIETSDISTIIYSNGDVEILQNPEEKIAHETPAPTAKTQPKKLQFSKPKNEFQDTIYYARDWHGTQLPYFAYSRVKVPNKKGTKLVKRWRYVAENMVFKSSEMDNFYAMYCPSARKRYKTKLGLLIAQCATIPLLLPSIILGIVGLSLDSDLEIYNQECAGSVIGE